VHRINGKQSLRIGRAGSFIVSFQKAPDEAMTTPKGSQSQVKHEKLEKLEMKTE
jgi:hypothetical protein